MISVKIERTKPVEEIIFYSKPKSLRSISFSKHDNNYVKKEEIMNTSLNRFSIDYLLSNTSNASYDGESMMKSERSLIMNTAFFSSEQDKNQRGSNNKGKKKTAKKSPNNAENQNTMVPAATHVSPVQAATNVFPCLSAMHVSPVSAATNVFPEIVFPIPTNEFAVPTSNNQVENQEDSIVQLPAKFEQQIKNYHATNTLVSLQSLSQSYVCQCSDCETHNPKAKNASLRSESLLVAQKYQQRSRTIEQQDFDSSELNQSNIPIETKPAHVASKPVHPVCHCHECMPHLSVSLNHQPIQRPEKQTEHLSQVTASTKSESTDRQNQLAGTLMQQYVDQPKARSISSILNQEQSNLIFEPPIKRQRTESITNYWEDAQISSIHNNYYEYSTYVQLPYYYDGIVQQPIESVF